MKQGEVSSVGGGAEFHIQKTNETRIVMQKRQLGPDFRVDRRGTPARHAFGERCEYDGGSVGSQGADATI